MCISEEYCAAVNMPMRCYPRFGRAFSTFAFEWLRTFPLSLQFDPCCSLGGRLYGPTSLWTPTVAQGTSGTTTVISPDGSPSLGPTLNNFGQVGTWLNGSAAIWTPSIANGTSGTATPNAQLLGLRAMNSFGQAIISSSPAGYYSAPTMLFTPVARNGTVGTFTATTGLAGATQHVLAAIADSGTIVGYSCVSQITGSCQNRGFIWTPTTPNGVSGTTVEMPMPAGFVAVTPIAMNATGSIVGTMATSTGSAVPFLYTAGTYYDLTTIAGVPVGSIPAAINQAGQIVLNESGYNNNVYLLTPARQPTGIGVYRSGQWQLDANRNGISDAVGDRTFNLGWLGATQFVADWNGDGKTEVGVYSNGYWFLDYDGNGVWDGGVKDKLVPWGWAGVTPFVGDWNGDGRTKIGVYSNGFWFLDYNGDFLWDGGIVDKQVGWGWAGVTPLVGDWNGNGRTKIGVYANGFWFLDYDGNYVWDAGVVDKQVGWGWTGVTTVVGDWNGDGRTKIGVYAGGYWYLDYDGNYLWEYPAKDNIWALGWTGTIPVIGDWTGDGKSKPGAFINGYWYLDYNGNGAFDDATTDRIYAFGAAGDTPVVGRW
jgi:hypothetical protein